MNRLNQYIVLLFTLILVGCKSICFEKKDNNSLVKDINQLTDTIYIQEGHYVYDDPIFDGVLEKNVAIIGKGKVVVECRSSFIRLISPSYTFNSKTLLGSRGAHILRYSEEVSIEELIKVSHVYISSDDIVEKAWGYKKGELHEIDSLGRNFIDLSSSLLFDYDYTDKVALRFFDSKKVHIENIEFRVNDKSKWDGKRIVQIDGCSLTMKNVSVINLEGKKKGNFLGCHYCNNVYVNDFSIDGFSYGLLFNYSRDVHIHNVKSDNTVHPIVPATFTANLTVDGLKGSRTALDAHPSFNIEYKNVQIENGVFNCRAFGVRFENCNFISPMAGDITYIGVGNLTEKYEFLSKEYDTEFLNVVFVRPIRRLNGLNFYPARKLTIKNSTTQQVSTMGFVDSLVILDSKIGRFQNYQTNCKVRNTIFDASLQGIQDPKPPLSFSYSGKADIEDCIFKGFDKSFLIDYVHSPKSQVSFVNCEFNNLRGIVKKFGDREKQYRGLKFEKSEFKKVKNISKQIPNSRNFLIYKKKN